MAKLRPCLYYITLFIFLQVFALFSGVFTSLSAHADDPKTEVKITTEQKNTIIDHCDTIKDNLKTLQRTDSRARVYLGRFYETILTNFITPLNLRLVENNLSSPKLIENQTNFASRRTSFVNDYISYQQSLEELVNTNCKAEPELFYARLSLAREKRKTVSKDVSKLRDLASEQVKQVEVLKNGTK